MAQDGLNVAINDIASKREKLEAVVKEIRALGREVVAVPADISSETEVKEMVDQTVAALRVGGLDVVSPNSVFMFHVIVLSRSIADGGNAGTAVVKAFLDSMFYRHRSQFFTLVKFLQQVIRKNPDRQFFITYREIPLRSSNPDNRDILLLM